MFLISLKSGYILWSLACHRLTAFLLLALHKTITFHFVIMIVIVTGSIVLRNYMDPFRLWGY